MGRRSKKLTGPALFETGARVCCITLPGHPGAVSGEGVGMNPNAAVWEHRLPESIFFHCLPAHRDESSGREGTRQSGFWWGWLQQSLCRADGFVRTGGKWSEKDNFRVDCILVQSALKVTLETDHVE